MVDGLCTSVIEMNLSQCNLKDSQLEYLMSRCKKLSKIILLGNSLDEELLEGLKTMNTLTIVI